MIPDLNDVIDRLCDVVASTGVRATPFVDKPVLPCALVYPDDLIEGYGTMRGGTWTVPMVVQVLASTVDLAGQSRWLHAAISPWGEQSIPAAILAAKTLGTAPDENPGHAEACMSAAFKRTTEYGLGLLLDGTRVLSAKAHVDVVLTRRS